MGAHTLFPLALAPLAVPAVHLAPRPLLLPRLHPLITPLTTHPVPVAVTTLRLPPLAVPLPADTMRRLLARGLQARPPVPAATVFLRLGPLAMAGTPCTLQHRSRVGLRWEDQAAALPAAGLKPLPVSQCYRLSAVAVAGGVTNLVARLIACTQAGWMVLTRSHDCRVIDRLMATATDTLRS